MDTINMLLIDYLANRNLVSKAPVNLASVQGISFL